MWPKKLLSIFLLGLISGAISQTVPGKEANIHYIMTVQPMLPSDKTGQVCVYIECEEEIQLEVTLEHLSTIVPIFSDQISSPFFECRGFPIPKVNIAQLVYVTFSAIGNTVERRARTPAVIDAMPEACFVQMEKKLYRPGDTVRCRLFCLNSDLMATNQNFTKVYLVETTGARVAQIVEPLSDHGVISVEFILNEDASPGLYSIISERESGDPVMKYFTVERYQLPRFDAKVTNPNTISVLEKSAQIEVFAQYVYGKPLTGTVIGKCCRNVKSPYGREGNCLRGLENICVHFTGEVNLDSGSYIENLNLDTFKLQFSEYEELIYCEVTTKEAGTGVLDTKSSYIYITSQPINIQLDYSSIYQYYKHGLDLPFTVLLTNEKGEPMPNEIIIIEVDGTKVQNITTDAEGRGICGIDTTPYYKPNITIRASYQNEDQCYHRYASPRFSGSYYNYIDFSDYPYTEITAYRFFSESDSFLQIKKLRGELSCYNTYSIEVEYKVTEAGVGEAVTSTSFYYLVKAKETIVLKGQKQIDLTDSWTGSFTIDLFITPEYATIAQVLFFGPMKTEIISDTLELSIKGCFRNEVSLTFSESVVKPGSEVQQELSAAPGSLCGLRASDASIDLLSSYDDFNPGTIYNYLRYYQYGFQVQNFNLEDPIPPCEDPNTEVFCNGRYYRPVSSPTDGDTYDNLRSFSVIFASDLRVRKPQVCGMENVNTIYYAPFYEAASATIETFRSNFDDSFGWQTVFIGSDGTGTAISTIPDTITEWNSDMFCISEAEGVGLTNQTAKITTFLPFFLELTLPQYSTRGEKIIVDTTAANYLDRCIKVRFTIESSDGFVLNSLSEDDDDDDNDDDDEVCICNGERISKQWSLDFISLGDINITASASITHFSDSCDGDNGVSEALRKDTVQKVIIVEAEGIKREFTSSHLTIVKDSTIEREVTIDSPDYLVEGSFKLYLTVVGDTVGLMADNLANLLSLPDGCCEQNLARLLPIVYLLKYFKFIGSLDDELYEKAKSYLSVGYGRQLACRTTGGRYSVFRNSYVQNSWLDINTFYTFEQMKEFVFIDESIQEQTLLLLGAKQNLDTGCFRPVGSLFTTQDKENNDLRYTAYVVKRLLQSDFYSITAPLIEGGLNCIQAADFGTLDTYTLSYIFSAVALAKNFSIWETVNAILTERAINEDGTVHWQADNLPPVPGKSYSYFLPTVPSSAEIDVTANVMFGILKGPELTQDKIDLLGQIAIWLSFSQNSRGGYSSSQDTTAAIEAMTEYGRVVYVEDTNVEIVVNLGDNEVACITVNKDNRMLVQRLSLPVVFGVYKLSSTGTGNPLVQLTAKFNTEVTEEDAPFLLNITTRADTCTEGVAHVIYTDICASYIGSLNQTNMVLIDVKELTGYSIDRGSVYQNLQPGSISDVDFKDNHVHLYVASMAVNAEVCITLTSFLDRRALLYQDSSIIIRDFYTDDSAYAKFSYPCSPSTVAQGLGCEVVLKGLILWINIVMDRDRKNHWGKAFAVVTAAELPNAVLKGHIRKQEQADPSQNPEVNRVPFSIRVSANGMEFERLTLSRKGLSDNVVDTLLASKKKVTSNIYLRVWKTFTKFVGSEQDPLTDPNIPVILDFLQAGIDKLLRRSTPKVQIAALSSFFDVGLAECHWVKRFI
ncbi:ovostatin-like [Rhinoderma darwinii]|uniref:ovostatin-like n=1 Tax=Rhinoderma darwinii TaxID=43563 RepID=UPI003F6774D8